MKRVLIVTITFLLIVSISFSQNKSKISKDNAIVDTGAVVEKIPMANIFYRVDVRKDKIQPTKEVVSSQWFSLDEIKQLKLVPTTSDTDKLYEIIQKELNRSK